MSTRSLSCPICLEPYDQPKVLPCLHTFCEPCLVKLGRSRESEETKGVVAKSGKGRKPPRKSDQPSLLQITCPLCKAVHSTPIELLPTDYSLQQEVAIQALTNGEKGTAICGLCEGKDHSLFGFCPQCRSFICQGCYDAHQRMKTFKSHSVVPMSDFNPTMMTADIYCPDHKDELISHYCVACEVSVCRECAISKHCTHDILTTKDAKERVKGSMLTLHNEVSAKLREFKGHMELIIKTEDYMIKHQDSLKAEVNKTCDAALRDIEAARHSLLSKIDGTYGQESKKIWAEKDIVERTILGQESCLAFTDRLLQSTNDSNVVYLSSQALRQMKVLKESDWNAKSIIPTFIIFKANTPPTVGDISEFQYHYNPIRIEFSTMIFTPAAECGFSVIAKNGEGVFNSPAIEVAADINEIIHHHLFYTESESFIQDKAKTNVVKCKIGNYDASKNCWNGTFSCGKVGFYMLTVTVTAFGKAIATVNSQFNVQNSAANTCIYAYGWQPQPGYY